MTPVVQADDDRRVGHAPGEGVDDLVEVGEDGAGRLVPLVGVLAQQPLDDGVDGPGDVDAERAQLRRWRVEVLAQDLADVGPLERGPTGQALEEQDAHRVEVGALVGGRVEGPGRLGREVAGGADRLVADVGVQPGAAGEAEVDQDRPLDGILVVDDHVGGLDVAVQHVAVVGHLQGVEDVGTDPQGGRHRDRAVAEAVAQAAAGDEGLDEVHVVAVLPHRDEGSGAEALQPAEHTGLVLQAQPGRLRHLGRQDGLDDHLVALLEVHADMGRDPQAALQDLGA